MALTPARPPARLPPVPQVPVVAMLDGNLQGPALGLAAHARFSVVTDRTRLLLAGPEYGFVTESFATYQACAL